MWAAIMGMVILMYIGIFSLLKASSKGEEVSRKHRAVLLAARDENFDEDKVDEIESEDNERKRKLMDP